MKKMMMIAVMAIMCLTANAQKMRHGAGQITIQPMVGFSVGTTSLNIPHLTATEAIKLADRNMYIDKTAKKAELNKEA